MIKQNLLTWDLDTLKNFFKESVLSPTGGVNLKLPLPGKIKPEEIDDKLNIKKVVAFIQHDHELHPI